MLKKVKTAKRDISDYEGVVGNDVLSETKEIAKKLKGMRVLHINATARGGGVAELLNSIVPIMNSLGIETEWRIIFGDHEFFKVTKAIHNALQGQKVDMTEEMKDTYRRMSVRNSEAFSGTWDAIIVHDPQPAPLPELLKRKGSPVWVWHCHLDMTKPDLDVADFIKSYLNPYDAFIFTDKKYIPGELPAPVYTFTPCIDPMIPKNIPFEEEEGRKVLSSIGINPELPLITQVARFDPWKNPMGVIDVYRMVKMSVPDLRLALVGSIADDDPEGWEYYERTARHAGLDYDIHLLHDYSGTGEREVNIFQSLSDVVLQMSKREGFGLTVTEAMWKRKPVVASPVGGIVLQIEDGISGFLANTDEEFTQRIIQLVEEPDLSKEMGDKARESVREKFLIPRMVRDYISLLSDLS